MKNLIKLFFGIFIVIMTFNVSFSQGDSMYLHPRYQLSIANAVATSNTYEFDIYLRQTAASHNETVMLYGTCQYFLKINALYLAGGTLTCAIIGSDLTASLRPPNCTYSTTGAAGPRIQLPANLPTSPSTTDTIRYLTPGTKIVRVRLTNSVPFNTSEDINLRWRNANAGNPFTKITVFTDSNNIRLVDVTDSTGHYNGPTGVSNPNQTTSLIPTEFNLAQNYPNPFNPTTKIEYALPVDGRVSMKVFDITGREMMNLVNDVKSAGYYSVNFNGANLASGIYFYRIEVMADGVMKYQLTRRMVLVK